MRDPLADLLRDFPDLTQEPLSPVCEELIALTRRYAAYVVTERREKPELNPWPRVNRH